MKKAWFLLVLVVLTLSSVSCVKPAHNSPPDDTSVRLDSTNLPIVFIRKI